jgi:hypothetical protein
VSVFTQVSEHALNTMSFSASNVGIESCSPVASCDLRIELAAQTVSPLGLTCKTVKTNQIKKSWIDFICKVVGEPHYSFTLTLRPLKSPRSSEVKVKDAKTAMSWFVNVLNTKCFGHSYRRKNIELGFFATLEGLGAYEQPHWHGAIRLPKRLPNEKFLLAFEAARQKTKRFGRQFDLTPYYGKGWFEYTIKTGPNSVYPEFLRAGTP